LLPLLSAAASAAAARAAAGYFCHFCVLSCV